MFSLVGSSPHKDIQHLSISEYHKLNSLWYEIPTIGLGLG